MQEKVTIPRTLCIGVERLKPDLLFKNRYTLVELEPHFPVNVPYNTETSTVYKAK